MAVIVSMVLHLRGLLMVVCMVDVVRAWLLCEWCYRIMYGHSKCICYELESLSFAFLS